MAVLTSFTGIYDNPDFVSGQFTIMTSTKVVYKEGTERFVFKGNFTFDGEGKPSGIVDSLRHYESRNSEPLVSITEGVGKDIADIMAAGSLDDWQFGGFYAVREFIFSGNDTLTAEGGGLLRGFAGDDVLYGGVYTSGLSGGDGNDTIYMSVRGEALGGRGHDTIYGSRGEDYLFGGDGGDTLYGYRDLDVISGGSGRDKLFGGAGTDYLAGENGNDVLRGGADADALRGGAGNDRIFGGSGTDKLIGGGGDSSSSTFTNPAGDDRLTGGAGSDTFFFIESAGGNQVVTDFTDGEDMLYFLDYSVSTATEALAFASMIGGDTVFDFGTGGTITLENFDLINLDAADMNFGEAIYAAGQFFY